MSSRILRAVRAGVTAIAVVAVAALGAAPAHAAPTVDGSQQGSITVHKFERPSAATGLPNNGTELTPEQLAALKPIAGVTFTAQQVQGIDLTSNTGWTDASALSKAFDPSNAPGSITGAGYTLGTATSGTTNGSGVTTLGSLPVGQYLVTETQYPAGVTPSAPFLVTVPLTNPDTRDSWLYNIHVYPKNSTTTADKKVTDGGASKVGDKVTFDITGSIPNDDVISGYRITDQIDSKLNYTDTAVTLSNGAALVLGTDYTVTEANGLVTVDFTTAGRAKLAANNTAKVQVKINTTVGAIGEITNKALLYPNAPSFDVKPGDPNGPIVTPEVITKWGSITVTKVDDKGAALKGAVFSVYLTEADAKANTNPVNLGGQTTFEVVNNDGTLTISGLRYSGFANGVDIPATDANYRNYFLAEVKAPQGFELLGAPVPFIIDAATTNKSTSPSITNVPSNAGFNLPLTGAAGTTMFAIIGGVLLAAGLLLAFVVRRRRSSSAN